MLANALGKIREACAELEKLAKTDFQLIDVSLTETYEVTNALSYCVAVLRRDRVTITPGTLGNTFIRPEKKAPEDKTKVYGGPAWVKGQHYRAIVRVRFDKQAVDALKPYQVRAYYFKKYYAKTGNEKELEIAKEIGQVYVSKYTHSGEGDYIKVQVVDTDPAWQSGQEPYTEGDSK